MTPDRLPCAGAGADRSGRKLRMMLAVLAATIVLIGLDRWTKQLAAVHLSDGRRISLLDNLVILVYAENRGAFLSLGNSFGPAVWWIVLVVLPIAVILAVTVYMIGKKNMTVSDAAALVLLVSGGAGNLIDRIRYGKVVDFLNFGIGPVFRTGILNAADLYIFFLLILLVVRQVRKNPADREDT
jgi:signal peptidase II